MIELKCDCNERVDAKINSSKAFMELKNFFEVNISKGMFSEIKVEYPYYIGYSYHGKEFKYYATKWYRCNCCKCEWEFQYPDFPANGHIRKIESNNYSQLPFKWNPLII